MADTIQKNYRHEIDGLRTLAVTGATLHNFWENIFPCGYLGVDMFAVISGYVITTSLANKNYSSLKEFATGFYFRRLRRLYPALIFMVIVVCLISGFIQPSFKGGTMATIRTGISALLGTSNIYLIKQSSDYFSFIAKLNPFTATWSLGCEEQFYLIYPIILWSTGFARKTRLGKKNLSLTIITLSTISLSLFIYFWFADRTTAYFLMPTRFWEMGCGCLSYLIYKKYSTKNKQIVPTLLFIILLPMIIFIPLRYALFSTLFVVFLTCLIIITIENNSYSYKLLTNPFSNYIAERSYSLFLWRWPIVASILWVNGKLTFLTNIFGIIALFAIASFSYEFIENKSKNLFSFKNQIKNIINLILINLGISFSLELFSQQLMNERLYLYKGYHGRREELTSVVYDGMTCEFAPDVNKNDDNWKSCITRKNDLPSIFLLGSSHATNHFRSLEKIYKKKGFNTLYHLSNYKDFWNKENFTNFFESVIKDDIIIYAKSSKSLIASKKYENQTLYEINNLKDLVNKKGTKLYLVDDLPSTCDDIKRLTMFFKNPEGCNMDAKDAIEKRMYYTKLIKRFVDNKNIIYIDPLPYLCNKEFCPAIYNNKSIYADSSPHFSIANKFILVDFFYENLE